MPANQHKHWLLAFKISIQTRQNHFRIKQICLGVFAPFDTNSLQLSNVYGLAELMLSFCYQGNVIMT